MPVIQTIKFRRGTAAQWASANPVLTAGEMGLETDTRKFKFGTGSVQWNSLGYGIGVNDPAGMSVNWVNVLGKPETFPPSAHTHVKTEITDFAHVHPTSEITGLDTALSGKADVVHTHLIADITDYVPPVVSYSDTFMMMGA